MMNASAATQPVFNTPMRWTLRVLAWLAFFVAAKLAWHSVTQTSVAGCSVGSHNGCDAVLNSSWSIWLGVPVSVLGLGCYAALAGLSVLLGIASPMSRWVQTSFLMLGILGGAASIWFIGLQIFAIGEFCRYCMIADLCGIVIGVICAWAGILSWNGSRLVRSVGGSSANLAALRGAIPAATRKAPAVSTATAAPTIREAPPAAPRTAPVASSRTVPLVGALSAASAARRYVAPPSMPIALGGAFAMFLALVGGQLVFPAKTFDVQQVALKNSIDLNSNSAAVEEPESTGVGETHVTNRIPAEGNDEPYDAALAARAANEADEKPAETTAKTDPESDGDESPAPSTEVAAVKKERKVKFLGGKLTLDTYQHPILGSPEAEHIVVEMVSYDCPHCRKANKFVKQALNRYGDKVAVIVLTVPLEQRCNRLITDPAASHTGSCTTSGLACLVAKLKPAAFPRFHDFLMSGSEDHPPSIGSVISKAYGLADRSKLRDLRDNKEIAQQLEGYVDLFAQLRKENSGNKEFGLPIQIIGDTVMSGGIQKASDVFDAWEKNLDVKPR